MDNKLSKILKNYFMIIRSYSSISVFVPSAISERVTRHQALVESHFLKPTRRFALMMSRDNDDEDVIKTQIDNKMSIWTHVAPFIDVFPAEDDEIYIAHIIALLDCYDL